MTGSSTKKKKAQTEQVPWELKKIHTSEHKDVADAANQIKVPPLAKDIQGKGLEKLTL